jgi:proline iminopeptidase
MRRQEIDWVFRGGCRAIFPSAWSAFIHGLSPRELADPLQAYYARLTSEDAAIRKSASRRMFMLQASLGLAGGSSVQVWDGQKWDLCDMEALAVHATLPRSSRGSTGAGSQRDSLPPCTSPARPDFPGCLPDDGTVSAQQILTCHYSVHDGFSQGQEILASIGAVRSVPAIAVQGRNDMVCPVSTAYDLHRAWPELELQVVTEGGHSMYDPRISRALSSATKRMEVLVRERLRMERLDGAQRRLKREGKQ